MGRFASLTSRLVVTVVALVAIVAMLIGTATALALRANLTDQLDQRVLAAGGRVHGDADDNLGPPPRRLNNGYPGEPGTLGARIVGASGSGTILGSIAGVDTDLSAAQLSVLADVSTDGRVHDVDLGSAGSYRVVASTVDGMTFINGLPTKSVDNAVTTLVELELGLGVLAVLAAGGLGLVVVRRQLRPLREVAATAHNVAAMPLATGEIKLAERVPDRLTDERTEVGQVGSALNTLLEHVESSLSARHRSEQQVRQFVADASHELRTPLTTIAGYTELARRRPDDQTAVHAALDKVEEESGRMTSLVEDLLLLARLDAGRPLTREPVDLSRLLVETVSDARVVAPDHQWRLDIPEESVEATGDPVRLHQVITNLLTNARKYTPAGTTVTVRARPGEFVVHDNGPGFPADMVDHAFERFARGDTSRVRGTEGGAGLGLALVQAIVTAHGGRVALSSIPGSTSVTVSLPALPALPRPAVLRSPTLTGDPQDDEGSRPVPAPRVGP